MKTNFRQSPAREHRLLAYGNVYGYPNAYGVGAYGGYRAMNTGPVYGGYTTINRINTYQSYYNISVGYQAQTRINAIPTTPVLHHVQFHPADPRVAHLAAHGAASHSPYGVSVPMVFHRPLLYGGGGYGAGYGGAPYAPPAPWTAPRPPTAPPTPWGPGVPVTNTPNGIYPPSALNYSSGYVGGGGGTTGGYGGGYGGRPGPLIVDSGWLTTPYVSQSPAAQWAQYRQGMALVESRRGGVSFRVEFDRLGTLEREAQTACAAAESTAPNTTGGLDLPAVMTQPQIDAKRAAVRNARDKIRAARGHARGLGTVPVATLYSAGLGENAVTNRQVRLMEMDQRMITLLIQLTQRTVTLRQAQLDALPLLSPLRDPLAKVIVDLGAAVTELQKENAGLAREIAEIRVRVARR